MKSTLNIDSFPRDTASFCSSWRDRAQAESSNLMGWEVRVQSYQNSGALKVEHLRRMKLKKQPQICMQILLKSWADPKLHVHKAKGFRCISRKQQLEDLKKWVEVSEAAHYWTDSVYTTSPAKLEKLIKHSVLSVGTRSLYPRTKYKTKVDSS